MAEWFDPQRAHQGQAVNEIALGHGNIAIGVLVPTRLPGISLSREIVARAIGEDLGSEQRPCRPGSVLLTFANRESYEVLQRCLQAMARDQGWIG